MTNVYNPEKVLIIGNGFDLNLGLKTSYSHFVNSSQFSEINRPDSFFAHIYQRHSIQNWVDVEVELKNYSQSNNNDSNFENDYYELCNKLINYISNIDYSQIIRDSKAFKLIESLTNDNHLIFDFNYTNSISIIRNELGRNPNESDNGIIKLHGAAEDKKVIFGVEDSASIYQEHIFLKKSFPPHYRAISIYDQLINANEIHIFGHSLGETDHTYFKPFFEYASNPQINQKRRTIFLYYFNDQSYKQLHIQIDKLSSNRLSGFKTVNSFEPIQVG